MVTILAPTSCQNTFTESAWCLTEKPFSHKLRVVNATPNAIDSLERRIDQLLAQFDSVRAENSALRNRLLETQADRDRLKTCIDTAAERLEALKERLPAE
jgi:septal ring factor EnvC (AmiA/AmiB activator)